jgi:hypothetical protein
MTTFEKRIEKWAENKVTAVVKKRFDDAGMKWEAEFTVDSFIEWVCVLNKHSALREYRAAETNSVKPVI